MISTVKTWFYLGSGNVSKCISMEPINNPECENGHASWTQSVKTHNKDVRMEGAACPPVLDLVPAQDSAGVGCLVGGRHTAARSAADERKLRSSSAAGWNLLKSRDQKRSSSVVMVSWSGASRTRSLISADDMQSAMMAAAGGAERSLQP